MTATKRKPVLPPVYFLLAIVMMVLIHFLVAKARWLFAPFNLAGFLPIAAGLVLGISGNLLFKRHNTTIKPFEESTTVVTRGVFAFSRNPMYLGMVLILVGIGLVQGSATPFVVVPLFTWLITARFIVKEEAMLEAKFGDAYLQYKRRVRRWF